MPDRHDDVGALGRIPDLQSLRHAAPDRLLDKRSRPGIDRRQRDLPVQAGRHDDGDGIQAFAVEHFPMVLVAAHSESPCYRVEALLIGVRHGDQIRFHDLRIDTDMIAAHVAQADDSDVHAPVTGARLAKKLLVAVAIVSNSASVSDGCTGSDSTSVLRRSATGSASR